VNRLLPHQIFCMPPLTERAPPLPPRGFHVTIQDCVLCVTTELQIGAYFLLHCWIEILLLNARPDSISPLQDLRATDQAGAFLARAYVFTRVPIMSASRPPFPIPHDALLYIRIVLRFLYASNFITLSDEIFSAKGSAARSGGPLPLLVNLANLSCISEAFGRRPLSHPSSIYCLPQTCCLDR